MFFTQIEKTRSLNYLDINGIQLQLDEKNRCHIKESLLSRLSIDEMPEGIKFIFMDEPTYEGLESVSIQMAAERLGDELILRVRESGNDENWQSEDYMKMYFASLKRKLENRQTENFDIIIEISEQKKIGYCFMAKCTEIRKILEMSDIVYRSVKESVKNFNIV